MARKRRQRAEGGGSGWLATYGDMVTLLLTFFVLLFAFSSIDVQKFQKMMISFQGALGVLPGGKTVQRNPSAFGGDTGQDAGDSRKQTLTMEQVAREMRSFLREQKLEKSVRVRINQRGVVVSLSDQILFNLGRVDVAPEGKRVLFKIGELLKGRTAAIAVEGHTDNRPLRGGPYRDNWGLSSMRAAAVASYLHAKVGIDPKKLQAVGYGSFRPVVPNDTAEHQDLNRRVDLVILSRYPKR